MRKPGKGMAWVGEACLESFNRTGRALCLRMSQELVGEFIFLRPRKKRLTSASFKKQKIMVTPVRAVSLK